MKLPEVIRLVPRSRTETFPADHVADLIAVPFDDRTKARMAAERRSRGWGHQAIQTVRREEERRFSHR
jgi:hypothetical protein